MGVRFAAYNCLTICPLTVKLAEQGQWHRWGDLSSTSRHTSCNMHHEDDTQAVRSLGCEDMLQYAETDGHHLIETGHEHTEPNSHTHVSP